jgi:hypothetical protein
VLLQEMFSSDVSSVSLYVKMPVKGIVETKSLRIEDGNHILIECLDTGLKFDQQKTAHTILL